MKKILLLLLISIGLISLVYYELQNDKATTAIAEAEKAAILDAELAAYEADLLAKLALQEKEVEMARQASLDAFQAKLADEKAAAAASTAAYQDSLLDAEFASFEAQLAAELASQEMMAEIQAEMARQAALDAFQAKLAADKAAAAASTAAYQDSLLDAEFAALEAQIRAEADAAAMMAEIEREMALAAFLQNLEDEKAAAAASTAAYQASLADEEVIGVIEEVVVTEAAHEACKYALGLSDSNIALFKAALADGSLFNKGPQVSTGTEFTANRWDAYATCVSNYVNPF